jgi:eukaryotic-like serine/threonine-protein kinase
VSHVFISHVEEDADVALGIALGLEKAGFRTWCYEVDCPPGPSYLLLTGQAVEGSSAVVLVVSADSLGSNQVTSEVVRGHESGRPFIPVLRSIRHVELQTRRPDWRAAIGAATSVRIPPEGAGSIVPRIVEGLTALGINPGKGADSARLQEIGRELDELGLPESARLPGRQAKPAGTVPMPIEEEAQRPAPAWNLPPAVWRWVTRSHVGPAPILGAVGLAAVIGTIVLVVLLLGGGDHGSRFVIFPSTPGASTPTVAPAHLTSVATTARPSATAARTARVSPTAAPILTATPGERVPKVLWSFQTSFSFSVASPVVVDQVAYIGDSDGVYALDAATGEERWRFDAGCWASAPSLKDGVIYVGGTDLGADMDGYYLYALDAATGEERWRFQAGGSVTSAAVAGGTVYVGSDDNYVYALDGATGKWLWRFKAGFEGNVVGFSAPAVADGVVYIGGSDEYVYALDAGTGELRWRYQASDGSPALAVVERVVYVSGWLGGLDALDAGTGEVLWGFGSGMSGPAAASDGVVYVGSNDGAYAVDATTGEERWLFHTDGWFASPVVVDGVVYVTSHVIPGNEYYIHALDTATGEERWRFQTGGTISPPAVANGIAYIASGDGYVYALDTSTLEERWVPERPAESGP